MKSRLQFDGVCEFIGNNHTDSNGGAIWTSQSTIQFKPTAKVEIHGNTASIGGGMFLIETQLSVSCEVIIRDNTALHMGGGIFAYRSEIAFEREGHTIVLNNNKALNGGGAALIALTLNVYQGTVIFHNNTAHNHGGAVYMEHTSTLYVHITEPMVINSSTIVVGTVQVSLNSAQNGGGLFVDDETSGYLFCE